MKKNFLYVLLFITVSGFIHAQNRVGDISGYVIDKKDGEALIGATIQVKNKKAGATTNNSGYFVITDIAYADYTLVVSYIGYTTETVIVTLDKPEAEQVKVYLAPESIQTSTVVITADSVRTIDKLYEKPVSKVNLSSSEVNKIPRVIEADLLRALQTLPGITALSDFSSALYVRGGTPDQNMYLIDGTDVYNPEHAFGIFSTFNTNAIKKVELSKGGFGAEYGGRLSSVLNVTNLDGNRNEFEGFANISLIAASTTLQMPLGSFGSLSGSFRRTYIDQTYAKLVKEIPAYYFYDGNLKMFLDIGGKDKLTVSYFAGNDNLDYRVDKDKPSSFGFLYEWGNKTSSINWRHVFSSKLFSSFWTTYSAFQSDFNFESVNFREKNKIHDFSLKGALEYYYSSSINIKFGFEQKFLGGMLQQFWDNGKVDVSKNRTHTIGYLSGNWKPFDDLEMEPGIRYNYFNSDADYQNFEPRFSAKYRLTESSNLKFACGKYYQYINRIPRLFFSSIWTTADEFVKESSADHYIIGYQKAISEVYEFEAEVYLKKYHSIYQYNQLVIAEVEPSGYEDGKPFYSTTKGLFNRGDGNSYGLELMVRKDVGSVTGWLAYSLSRTEYVFDAISNGETYIPRHDRSHVVNAVVNVDWNHLRAELKDEPHQFSDKKWFFSMNFVYSSGQPITVPSSAYFINDLPDWNDVISGGKEIPGYSLYPSSINKYRLPAYIRLDASVTYEIDYGSWVLAPYLQVFNLGNRKNVWFINYNEELTGTTLKQEIEKVNMLPILPSIGVNIKF
ncbi:MAG: carboxypeptidase-like regulatory domain-containing protein [Ignavibacteriales bacterium]|nr:carboxypeptidase-like regulatory domain-containing protein [Ignavibacteriales bacterium]